MSPTNGLHWSFWVVGAIALLYNLAGVANFISQLDAGAVAAMPEAYRAVIEGRPVWATAAFATAVFAGALGCLLLLLKQSAAYYVFVLSLLGASVTMIHVLGVAESGLGPQLGNVAQLVVTVFLIGYSKYAQRKGWLS